METLIINLFAGHTLRFPMVLQGAILTVLVPLLAHINVGISVDTTATLCALHKAIAGLLSFISVDIHAAFLIEGTVYAGSGHPANSAQVQSPV